MIFLLYRVPSLYTQAQQTSRNIAVAQTYTPPKLEGIIQPTGYSLPTTPGGTQQSEAGPIRHRQSRPVSERPSQ